MNTELLFQKKKNDESVFLWTRRFRPWWDQGLLVSSSDSGTWKQDARKRVELQNKKSRYSLHNHVNKPSSNILQ